MHSTTAKILNRIFSSIYSPLRLNALSSRAGLLIRSEWASRRDRGDSTRYLRPIGRATYVFHTNSQKSNPRKCVEDDDVLILRVADGRRDIEALSGIKRGGLGACCRQTHLRAL